MAKNPSPREERERTEMERRRWRQEKEEAVLFWLAGTKERGEGYLRCPRRGSKIPSTQTRH